MLRRIGFYIIPVMALGLFHCGKGASQDLSTNDALQDSINAFNLLADSKYIESIKSELGIAFSAPAPVSQVTPLSSSLGVELSSSAGVSLSSGVVLPSSSAGNFSSSSTIVLTPSSSSGVIVPLSSSSIGIILPPSSSIKPLSSSVVVITPSSSNKPLSSSVVVLTPSSSSKPPVSSSVVVVTPSSSSKPPSSSSAAPPVSSSAGTPTGCTCDEGCASPLTAGEEGYVGGAVSRCFFRTTGYARTNACDVFEVNGVAQTANVESYTGTGIPAINGGWYVFIKAAAGCWFGVK